MCKVTSGRETAGTICGHWLSHLSLPSPPGPSAEGLSSFSFMGERAGGEKGSLSSFPCSAFTAYVRASKDQRKEEQETHSAGGKTEAWE